jgi:hypothetical protein
MKLAIMQPYFFPYIGYFQLINAVDEFVIYDNIEFTKKGWINRNRILVNGKDAVISLPLKKASDFLNINQRYLSDTWPNDRIKLLNKINETYKKAPHFDTAYQLFERCLIIDELNLFHFIHNSIKEILFFLDIKTKITISSNIYINHDLKSEEKVIEICKKQNTKLYINPIGGLELYSKNNFISNDINISFQKIGNVKYRQFGNEFVPSLSILDLLMFNTKSEIDNHLKNFTLI